MPEFELPRNLVRATDRHDPDGSRHAWLATLPLIIDDLARRWSLALSRPFQPGGLTSWVAPARDATGHPVVLKVGWQHDEARHEADGLRTWDGDGTVRLHDAVTLDSTSALLLEACEPGTALYWALPPLDQDVVVANLLRRLWINPPAGHPYRPLRCMCRAWADEFEEKYAMADGTTPRVDPALARTGVELLRSLPDTADRSALLCTDLHPGNVLSAEREPWLIIDPKPYVGDPTYDPLQHMLNFPDRLTADAAGFARRMANMLDLDSERMCHWLFARCVQESIDRPYLVDVVTGLAP